MVDVHGVVHALLHPQPNIDVDSKILESCNMTIRFVTVLFYKLFLTNCLMYVVAAKKQKVFFLVEKESSIYIIYASIQVRGS